MVFRGKPSTGCKKCRQRKIKCDERPGGCVKCIEKGFVCPGYDDLLDRFFQDESAHVKEKAKKANAKAIAARDSREARARARVTIFRAQDPIGIPLLCPLIDQGIAFFMSNYALGLDQPPMQSEAYHRHLSTQGFHPIIATSMTALGLAGISNISMNANFKREAMQWYLKALQMTNAAITSPTEAKSDNTLFATMLLGMFEATNNDTSLSGWSCHVDGSASLLKMRGANQFSTPAGRRMYWQTVGLLAMNCMGKGIPLPEYVHDMNKVSEEYEDENDPSDRYYHLHIQVTDFRAQILLKRVVDLHVIVDRALELDASAQRVFENAASEWNYEEVRAEGDIPGVFDDYYHIYAHMSSAQTWNWVRYNRIYLHDIIRNCLLAGFSMCPPVFVGPRYMRLLEDSTQTLQRMQADILASIPQHLHDTPKSPLTYKNNLPTSPDRSLRASPPPPTQGQRKFFWSNFCGERLAKDSPTPAIPRDRLPIVRVSGGWSSIWAVYIAGAMPVATQESQAYVLHSFSRIETEFGINQAKVLANCLRTKMHLDAMGERPFEIAPTYLPI